MSELYLLKDALLAGAIVGAICGGVGVFVVLRRLAFVTDGIAHASLLGIAVSSFAGVPLLIGTLTFSVLFASTLSFIRRFFRLSEDAGVGVLFSSCFALAIVILNYAGVPNSEVFSFLFGDLLLVSSEQLFSMMIVALVVLAIMFFAYRMLECFIVDEQFSKEVGVSPFFANILINVMVALTVTVGVRASGVVLVTALVTIPASLALRISRSIKGAVIKASCVGVAVTELGIVLSFVFDTPTGATVILTAGALFLIGNAILSFRTGGSSSK